MANNMFQKGFKVVKEEQERQEENRKKMGKGLWRFFLTEGEAELSFLTEEPINFYEHTLKGSRNGKETYDNKPCTGSDCEYCDNGDRPSFKSAWLVVDHREFEYTDKNNKKQKGNEQIRLFVYGTKVAGQLDRKSQRYGLVGQTYIMERIGKGTSTTYTFENGEKQKYTSKEIEALLPEALREDYDGSMDSLYDIIKDQIRMLVEGDTGNNNSDNEEENEEEDTKVRNKLVNVDDDEEERRPVKKLGAKKLFKSKENSLKKNKPSIKKSLKKSKEDDMPF